ncbi:hypothetical protein [Sinobaca sp. H24]
MMRGTVPVTIIRPGIIMGNSVTGKRISLMDFII